MQAIIERSGQVANIDEDAAVHKDLADFPCDAVVTPKQ